MIEWCITSITRIELCTKFDFQQKKKNAENNTQYLQFHFR